MLCNDFCSLRPKKKFVIVFLRFPTQELSPFSKDSHGIQMLSVYSGFSSDDHIDFL